MKENYYKITDPELKDKIKEVFSEEVGTYILHWYKNDTPRKICRLLDIDCDGIFYIGETDKTLYSRVASLASAIKANTDKSQTAPKERGHKSLSKKFFRLRKHININDLYVEVRKCIKSPDEDESELIEKYVAEFGELPPLNGNYGKYANWKLF